jgi:hypothetical protein
MIHRLALTIGGLGAVGVLGLALALGGNPLAASGATATAEPGVEALVDEQLIASTTGGSGVRTVVDTVYVRPADSDPSSDGRRNGSNPQQTPSPDATASPEPTRSPQATNSPEPTSSPEPTFDAFDDHGGDRDDDRSGHRDGDDDHDRSGHRDGDDDHDRSGHGDGDDDHDDDDRSGHGDGDDDDWDDD